MQKLLPHPMIPHKNPEWRVITPHDPRKSWQVCLSYQYSVLVHRMINPWKLTGARNYYFLFHGVTSLSNVKYKRTDALSLWIQQ